MTEMQKLMELLTNAKIPFESYKGLSSLKELLSTDMVYVDHVYYPNKAIFSEQFGSKAEPGGDYSGIDASCSVTCRIGSYGYEEGLLEILGLYDEEDPTYDAIGWITAKEVFHRIKKNYEEKRLAE